VSFEARAGRAGRDRVLLLRSGDWLKRAAEGIAGPTERDYRPDADWVGEIPRKHRDGKA
jgi:hypothetical protein